MASEYTADVHKYCPMCQDDVKGLHKLRGQRLKTDTTSRPHLKTDTFACPNCGKSEIQDGRVMRVTQGQQITMKSNTTAVQAGKPFSSTPPMCLKMVHGSATVFCRDCDKFFCENCINSHQLCDWMKEHNQTPVKEMSHYDIKYAQSTDSRKTCPEHELPITMFCKTCKMVICHTCLRYKHKDHDDQELVESTTEAKKGMNAMTDEAKKVINKQNDALKETGQTKETIHKDVKEAKESVKKRAQEICDTVRKHEETLLRDLDRFQEEAIKNLERIQNNFEARKADAVSLQKEIGSLLQFGKPIQQVERTPLLQEKLDAQQKVEAESMAWKYVCHRNTMSEESVKSMLGDVKLVVSETTLGQSLQQVPLKYTGDRVVTGMVVVGDRLCVVHRQDSHIWLYDIAKNQSQTVDVPQLEDPVGMALVDSDACRVVITDQNKVGGQLHYVEISDELDIAHLGSKSITPKTPRRISVSDDDSTLLIGQHVKPQFLVCDLEGNEQRQVTVTSPDETERFPYCVQQTASGYAAVMWDKYSKGIIQWLGEDGSCRQSYGHEDGVRGKSSFHMVRDSAGQLIVADHGNHRLHLVDSNGRLVQFLLTKDYDIKYPACVFLDEAAERLYVAHGKVGSMQVSVYKWPPKAEEIRVVVKVSEF